MNKNQKPIWALTLLALLLTVAVSGTLAYLVDATEEIVNTFTPTEARIVVDEEFDGEKKEDVSIRNDANVSDVDVYIRAKVIVTWKHAIDGNVYGTMPKSGTDYTITMGTGWDEGSDGYYYWPSIVPVGKNTGDLIEECVANDTAPEGYYLSVEIITQAIQAEGQTENSTVPVVDAWGVAYNAANKTISK